MANRKDQKGRVLKAGESQRKDGRYQYRYTGHSGKRYTVYAPNLKELRKKEEEIQQNLFRHLDYESGNLSVEELVQRYLRLKNGVRPSTKARYECHLACLKRYPFAKVPIHAVKTSTAKEFFLQLSGVLKYKTIAGLKQLLFASFKMAVEEDILLKNPFQFALADLIPNDSGTRTPLTKEQQQQWLSFLQEDKVGSKYYYVVVFLLETGLRIGEFCGLTLSDLDLEQGEIFVRKQLCELPSKGLMIQKPKTSAGIRTVPLSPKAKAALEQILRRRPTPKTEWIIDGESRFLWLQGNGKPKPPGGWQDIFQRLQKKYKKQHPESPLPPISPHVLRHTFCTNQAEAGMNPKALQYIMGHSSLDITWNVYTHANSRYAKEEMARVSAIQQAKDVG